METIAKKLFGLCLILFTVSCFAQQEITIDRKMKSLQERLIIDSDIDKLLRHSQSEIMPLTHLDNYELLTYCLTDTCVSDNSYRLTEASLLNDKLYKSNGHLFTNNSLIKNYLDMTTKEKSNIISPITRDDFFSKNRRNIYSRLWAFASLNYLYADLAGLMDSNMLSQYLAGVVDGTKITPQFLTLAACLMQIPLSNVFLPQIIKNEKTLQWIQIASGTIMTLVQASTLFIGKPTPYYALFSAFEIAATAYITIDAIKWKQQSKKSVKLLGY